MVATFGRWSMDDIRAAADIAKEKSVRVRLEADGAISVFALDLSNSPCMFSERPSIAQSDWRSMSLVDAVTAYRKSGRSIRFFDKVLSHFQGKTLGAIDNTAMAAAASAIYHGRAPATIRRQLYVPVNAVINFVKDRKLRAPKGVGQRTLFMRPDEVERLLQAALRQPSPFLLPLITFLIGQGARMGETLALRGCDVNLAARYAILRNTKNKQERTIALIPRVVAALSRLPTIGELRHERSECAPSRQRMHRCVN